MSRIGRMPVTIPQGVDVKIDGRTLRVKGPKGELVRTFHNDVTVAREDGTILVTRKSDEQATRALRGPDPYKHKGIKYAEERLRKKAGKAGKVGAKAG